MKRWRAGAAWPLLAGLLCVPPPAAASGAVRVESRGDRAVVRATLDAASLHIARDRVSAPGWSVDAGGDGPPLPVAEALLPGTGWRIERVSKGEVRVVPGIDLVPVPRPAAVAPPPGVPPEAWARRLAERLGKRWRQAARGAPPVAAVTGTVCRSGRCFTRVRIRPVRWRPDGGVLEVETSVTVELSRAAGSSAPPRAGLAGPAAPYTGADPAYPPEALTVRSREGIVHLDWAELGSLLGWDTASVPADRIQVWEDGAQVAIDVAAGRWVELLVRPRTGEDVPGEFRRGDWTDDRVYWFVVGDGSVASRRVTARSVPPAGATPTAWYPFTVRLRDESDCRYISAAVPSADDEIFHWRVAAWSSFYTPPEYVAKLPLTLPGLDGSSAVPVDLRVRLLGADSTATLSPQHRQRFWLQDPGGGSIVEVTDPSFDFDGETYHDAVFSLAAAEVAASDGVLHAVSADPYDRCVGSCPGLLWDTVYVDWVEATYPRLPVAVDGRCTITPGAAGTVRFRVAGFTAADAGDLRLWDVTDPAAPVRLEGWSYGGGTVDFQDAAGAATRYLAAEASAWIRPDPAELRPATAHDWASGPPGGADWIAVGPAGLVDAPALDELAAHRRGQGLRTAQVPLGEIYDEFSFGVPDPWAVRSFLAWAAAHWDPPGPSRVLLVGDASFDTKHQARPCSVNCGDTDPTNDLFAPAPFPDPAMPTWVEVVPGDGSGLGLLGSDSWFGRVDGDPMPDLAVGRLPGRDAAALQRAVDRILAAEGAVPEADPWTTRFEYVAGARDAAVLEPVLDGAADLLPGSFQQTRISFAHPPWNGSTADADGNGLSDMVDHMNAGRVVVNWVGHSGFQYLEASSTGTALGVTDVEGAGAPLTGETGLFTAGACYMGTFHHATAQPTLGEALLAGEAGGAASVVAHAAASYVYAADELVEGVQDTLTGLDRSLVVGDAFLEATWRTLTGGHDLEAESLVLLGDPAMRLPLPDPEAPASLWLVDQSCSRVRLAWNAAAGAAGYTLHRSVDGGAFEVLQSGIPGTTAEDGLAPPGHQVAYRVAAVDALGFSSAGSPALVVTTPPGPGGQGDVDCSCSLEAADLAVWIVHWNAVPREDPCGTGDVDGSGDLTLRDLAVLAGLFF